MSSSAPNDLRNSRSLAVLRISVGLLFLIFGEYKVFGTDFTLGGGFQFWINAFLDEGAYPFMVPVLRHFVLPHGTAIAFLVAYGELAIGLSLIAGLWVRWASAAGVLYMLALIFSSNFPLATNYHGGHVQFWQYFGASVDHSVFALCFVAFLVGDSERVWSVSAGRKASTERGRLAA